MQAGSRPQSIAWKVSFGVLAGNRPRELNPYTLKARRFAQVHHPSGRFCSLSAITLIHRIVGESIVWLPIIGLIAAFFIKDSQGEGGARKTVLIVGRILVVLLSIQWLLGVINYFTFPGDVRPSLIHPILMTLLVAGVHIAMGRARRDADFGKAGFIGLYAVTAAAIIVGWTVV